MSNKPGNINAIKHGLYAEVVTPGELARLRKMPMHDLRQEIAILRILIARLMKLSTWLEDTEAVVKLVRGLVNAIRVLDETLQAQTRLNGHITPLDEALAAALEIEPFYPDLEKNSQPADGAEHRNDGYDQWNKVFDIK